MLKIKSIKQKPGFCGVTSLQMVLEYFGSKVNEKELIRMTGATVRKGTSRQGIEKAAQQLGFLVMAKQRADFKDIKKWLDKKIPVIVDWFSIDEGHYSVAVGLDKKFIYLADPEIGQCRKIKRQDFKRFWFDFEGDFIKDPKDIILRTIIVLWKKENT